MPPSWQQRHPGLHAPSHSVPDRLAGLGGRHHVADLDLAIGDDHPIDQEFHQSPFLLECGTRQPLPHSVAERPGGVGQRRQLILSVCLGFELPCLLLQFLPAPLELTTPALILGQRHNTSEIGVGQTLELLLQTDLATSQPLLAGLQLLWQPVSARARANAWAICSGWLSSAHRSDQTSSSSRSAGLRRDGHFCSRCENRAGSLPVQE